ncbi:LuxR family transcriptional regulator [Micromonospora sp. KC606]|uniref:helix-turn-helix transcriptional regulator n=1 Tax=Micromonospora sp. KC606 TaxID=2530379 RepID=UPI001044DF6B|nr:LuxR family transcriptional regulator [Micromonospora sp. KC606]TDC80364.1 LuxR family transcriptional regulator [Micromonospora sp. KC606]
MSRWCFVGRTDELDCLRSAVEGVEGRGLFFSGTAGIGKSRLLREGVSALPADRYAIWSVAASTATAALPFGGLAQVLPAEQPPGLSPAGVLRWGVEVLQEQAAGRRIVLAIDDAHLLDPPSAALVHLIARQENAIVLGTLRNGEQIPLPIRALWTDDLVAHVELAPLGPAETTDLLAAILGGPVDACSADRLFKLSAGNPLLLRELVHAAAGGGELDRRYGVWWWTGRLELAPSLTDLIDARIGRLEPGVRAVVELVAFGEPLGLHLLNQAADPADVELAEERGLITMVQDDRRLDVRLARPLYGEVLRRHCPVSRTRRLRARLAELLEAVGARRRGDLLRVAVWRLDSGTAQDGTLLRHAAAQAFARWDVPLATRLARAALDVDGGFDAAELLATILMFADQSNEAIRVLDAVADEVTGDERSRWLTVRGMVSYWGLGQESTVDEIARAGAELTDPGDQARVRAFEAIMRLHRLDVTEALRLSRSVLDRPAAGVAARELARCTIAHLDAARGRFRRSATAIARVQAEASAWRADMPYLQPAMDLACGTRLALAGDLAGIDAITDDEFADLAGAGDFRLGTGYLAILQAYAARLRGRSREALKTSLGACAVLATSRVYAGLAHAERAQAAAWRGEAGAAAEAMAEADRVHTPGMAVLYPWLEQARGAVLAAGGDLPGAVKHLGDLADRLRADRFAGHEVLVLLDLVRLGAADAPVGPTCTDGSRRTVAQRLTNLSERVDGALPPLIARYARAAVDDHGVDLLAVADAFAERGLTVWASEAAAIALRALRRERAAPAAAAHQRLGALLGGCDQIRTPALEALRPALTDRERQIATLAADGVTSRVIAERLFLSTRTVENHLQRVYSKLGITGRAELPAALRSITGHDGGRSG